MSEDNPFVNVGTLDQADLLALLTQHNGQVLETIASPQQHPVRELLLLCCRSLLFISMQ